MSRICAVCGKKPQVANIVSHANNRTKKWVYPNVHKMHFVFTECADKRVHHDKVCTKCMKAQKVKKIV